jgi:RimJ/RimL family protein N-acetyltransferase
MDRYIYPVADRPDVLAAMLAWAVERMRATIEPGFSGFRADATAIGREINGELAGVLVYDTFAAGDCLWHVASSTKRWITRELIIRGVAYPFIQLKQKRITAMISEQNAPSLKLARGFGFVEEGRLRRAGSRDEDMIVFGMLRGECRWLPRGAQ